MELQGIYDELRRAGHSLYAVSYDSVDVLSAFSEKHGITYPLLSDEGSRVIRELGLLNDDAPAPIAGIPHPGTFVLKPDGTVRSKRFYPSYRERDTGRGVLAHVLGIDDPTGGTMKVAANGGVAVTARLDKDTYAWGQRIWLRVQVDIAPGLHLYGRPIPEGYYPLEVSVAPVERVVVGTPQLPVATPFRIPGLDEQFVVYNGSVLVELPLTCMTVDAGTLNVALTVSYQACSATDCLPPASVNLMLTIDEQPLIERPQPR